MKFAKLTFLIAGVYGLIVLLPQYFLEARTGHDYPPAITHPEFYYGFIGVGVAWQVLFLVISRDPLRYRAAIIPAVLEKATFSIAAVVLFLQHRISGIIMMPVTIDAILGVLFIAAYVRLAHYERGGGGQKSEPSSHRVNKSGSGNGKTAPNAAQT